MSKSLQMLLTWARGTGNEMMIAFGYLLADQQLDEYERAYALAILMARIGGRSA